MKELSLNILDIAENSVSAQASLIEITINEKIDDDTLSITISDNGKGMSEDFLKKVTDPFSTTRTTRKVGMGISLLKLVAEQSAGVLDIKSQLGVGTIITAVFQHSHIDRPPLGNMGQTIATLVSCNLGINFRYTHIYGDNEFIFTTKEIKSLIPGVPLNTPDVILWMQDYINDGIEDIYSEKL